MQWFQVATSVFEREDLNIYEKLCYIYLAKHLQTSEGELTMSGLAKEMGVEEIVARGAFHALAAKEIIHSENQVKPGTIIKAGSVESESVKGLSYDDKVNQVFQIVDEKISEKEAKIILNFAGNDLEKIREKYKIAKASQFQDKIEVLIHELQKKTTSKIIKKEQVEEKIETFELTDHQEHETQVNTYKINLMKKYKKI
ncbi:MAG: hypothetical protein JXR88_08390 [Clostridia bacterium]|nr:hypothetical protein [Clostridia bacterium]